MSLPQALEPHVVPIEKALEGVIGAVRAARYDRRTDERDPDSGLSVEQAREGIEEAMRNWAAVHEDFVAALDATLNDQPAFKSEINLALGALSVLDAGVSTEIALAQPLETLDGNRKLANIPDWPTEARAVLEATAFGPPGAPDEGLIRLLQVGTDDDPTPEPPGQLYGDAVGHAIRVIRRQTAESITSVFVGLTAVPFMDAIPLPANKELVDVLRDLLEEPGSWAVEKAVNELPRGISKWCQWALGKATQLLKKVLGEQRFEALDKLLAKGATTKTTDFISQTLVWVYDTGDVIERGEAAFDPPGQPLKKSERNKRGARLGKLEKSNKKWLGPIKLLSPGVGHLWYLPIPLPVPPHALPAAPAAAAVLLAWALVLSGDQLDTCYPYPNFWKGVVRRAHGE
ncbi:hypothetical protein [Mycobacterium sp. Aquia_213]|uniref:hypothetical protein n=1 Tax=Mycobacterium sp. Aquia_213 TaxID=2991728 RepID=UPI0022703B23|nr:hypothetical protein [Mycobacterium sp. Aquia_213]WAC92246.1 hypothetical protein LMQ14_03290 [Mycobacterium sp. Aquia_213]